NVGCGPAVEIQRLIGSGRDLSHLRLTLVDFSRETLDYTRARIDEACRRHGCSIDVEYVHESVHDLLKRPMRQERPAPGEGEDLVYCAGLFDYLSDRVCNRLMRYFLFRCN